MLRVLFFAALRERLGCDRIDLEQGSALTVAALREQLCAERGELWQEHLGADNVIAAVNQVVADDGHLLNDGDEVAFFPPVTGG